MNTTTERPAETLDPDTIPVRVEHLVNRRTRRRFCDGAPMAGAREAWNGKAETICPECLAIVRYLQRQGRVRL